MRTVDELVSPLYIIPEVMMKLKCEENACIVLLLYQLEKVTEIREVDSIPGPLNFHRSLRDPL